MASMKVVRVHTNDVVGVVEWTGSEMAGTWQFVPRGAGVKARALELLVAKRAKHFGALALSRYRTPYGASRAYVGPWEGYWGTAMALRDVLLPVGLDVVDYFDDPPPLAGPPLRGRDMDAPPG
jgi:hypothetical protein